MNRITLIGRLTANPVIQYTPSGKKVAEFRIAVQKLTPTEQYKADFFNCVAWEQSASFLENHIQKGDTVALDGRLTTRKYNKDGAERIVVEIVASNVYGFKN